MLTPITTLTLLFSSIYFSSGPYFLYNSPSGQLSQLSSNALATGGSGYACKTYVLAPHCPHPPLYSSEYSLHLPLPSFPKLAQGGAT